MKKLFLFIILNSYFLIPNIFSPVFAQNPLPTTIHSAVIPNANGVVDLQALETVFSNILLVATSFFGLAIFIVLISSGFNWLTSGGDPKKVEASKKSFTSAFLGLALLVLIWLILKLVSDFTKINLTIFTIPPPAP